MLLFFDRAEPTEARVQWYCSVSGVDSFQIQSQINFYFQSPGENKGRGRKLIEKIQLFFYASWLQVTVCTSKMTLTNIIIVPSFSICIFLPLYFQRTVGGGELSTSQMMSALSPSVNSWGEGAFLKVIFSGKNKQLLNLVALTQISPKFHLANPCRKEASFSVVHTFCREHVIFFRKVIKSPVLAIRKSNS